MNFGRKLIYHAIPRRAFCSKIKSSDLDTKLPYRKVDHEERVYLQKGIFERETNLDGLNKDPKRPSVDPNAEPFDEIYADAPDRGNFTAVEVLTEKQPELWFWVERLLKNNIAPDILTTIETPSGYIAPPSIKPNLPYFIQRTRSKLFPVYKVYEEREKRTLTVIQKVDGDLRAFERDLRGWLEDKYNQRILSAVHEPKGTLKLRGDFVQDATLWLTANGF